MAEVGSPAAAEAAAEAAADKNCHFYNVYAIM